MYCNESAYKCIQCGCKHNIAFKKYCNSCQALFDWRGVDKQSKIIRVKKEGEK